MNPAFCILTTASFTLTGQKSACNCALASRRRRGGTKGGSGANRAVCAATVEGEVHIPNGTQTTPESGTLAPRRSGSVYGQSDIVVSALLERAPPSFIFLVFITSRRYCIVRRLTFTDEGIAAMGSARGLRQQREVPVIFTERT